jgi:hypothetical protein
MRCHLPPLLLALVAFASGAAAETRSGAYDCVLTSQGGCAAAVGDICAPGVRLSRGEPAVSLRVDFDTKRAELNGIGGLIYRDLPEGADRVRWPELEVLGTQSLAFYDQESGPSIILIGKGTAATFRCRRSN